MVHEEGAAFGVPEVTVPSINRPTTCRFVAGKRARLKPMCLVAFAVNAHPRFRLIMAANRDEYHRRPTRAMHWWPDSPEILAGRDLQAGGTWLGISRQGRLATVTNYRKEDATQAKREYDSRGTIVVDFLTGESSAPTFSRALAGADYAGFSLLAADGQDCTYVSNRGDETVSLDAGIHGLGNTSLDARTHKLEKTKDALDRLIKADVVNETELLRLMSDRTPAPLAEVQNDNLPFKLARALTAPFILSPDYGTRCTTVLLWDDQNRISVAEKQFAPSGESAGFTRFQFEVS